MRFRLLAALSVLLAAPATFAQDSGSPSYRGQMIRLEWAAAPSLAEVEAAYPPKARRAGVGGSATLLCEIRADRRLSGCTILEESPRFLGFAAAAQRLVPDFLAPAGDDDGASLAGALALLPVAFKVAMLAGTPVFGQPRLLTAPPALNTAQSFPAEARAAHVATGLVDLSCAIADQGSLADCAVAKEDPPGLGFGKAALVLAQHFRFSVWSDDGLSTVGERVTIPIRYQAGEP